MRTRALRRILAVTALVILAVADKPAAADEAKHGGTMTLTYKDDIATLDPAISYDWQNPSMMQALFDGLMDYKPGTFELVPDIAETYSVSSDGKTYTFKLRQGVKFQNGGEVTAADFKYSFERILNPKTQSPAQSYFSVIDGPDQVIAGKSEHASGHCYATVIQSSGAFRSCSLTTRTTLGGRAGSKSGVTPLRCFS